MAFLTLGGTLYEVQHDGAAEVEPDYIGEAARTFSGGWKSGRRAKKRNWQFTLIPLVEADALAAIAQFGIDTVLVANGDALNSVAVNVIVEVTNNSYIPVGSGFQRVLTIALHEV